MTIRLTVFAALLMSYAHASTLRLPGPWQDFSSPIIMANQLNHEMGALPLEAHLANESKRWSNTHWPNRKGGINYRWNAVKKVGFGYTSPTFEQVKKMSLEELAQLSPSEKYDLYTGKYDYPVKTLVSFTANRKAPDWEGLCHGWAPAAIFHNEPTPKIMTNPQGIQIPFGSADIKALVSFYYAFLKESRERNQITGLRCDKEARRRNPIQCDEDLNAGAFHIILANFIGLRKESFIADIDRYKEVWNQPAQGYKSTIVADNLPVKKGAAPSAVKEMKISTDFYYVNESVGLSWEAILGTPEQVIGKKTYLYRLEVDQKGRIVGGTWESKDRPDFLWKESREYYFRAHLGLLIELPTLLNDDSYEQ